MMIFSRWLLELYALPAALFWTVVCANVGYGAFSLSLAVRRRRRIAHIGVLAWANIAWGAACVVMAVAVFNQASPFGVAHLLLEGAYVAALGRIEWRHRARLANAGP